MAYGSSMMMKPPPKKSGMKKPEIKPMRGLTLAQTKKLMEHSKMHKGLMKSKHMQNMVKFMRAGDTFAKAHKKAVELDKKKM